MVMQQQFVYVMIKAGLPNPVPGDLPSCKPDQTQQKQFWYSSDRDTIEVVLVSLETQKHLPEVNFELWIWTQEGVFVFLEIPRPCLDTMLFLIVVEHKSLSECLFFFFVICLVKFIDLDADIIDALISLLKQVLIYRGLAFSLNYWHF